MKLRALDIGRLPGIRPAFSLKDLDDGVNVVVGPNASGKSSLMRALRAALYKSELAHTPLSVEAVFHDEEGELTAARTGGHLVWQRAGQTVEPPPLPDQRFLSCYTFQVEDLLAVEGKTDKEIASQLATELAGGYDLPAVRDAWPFSLKTTHGKKEADELGNRDKELRRLQGERQQLRRNEQRLEQLETERDDAWRAQSDAQEHGRALELLDIQRKRQGLESRLEQFPEDMERLHGDELERLGRLHEDLEGERRSLETAQGNRQTAESKLRDAGLDEAELDEVTLADYRSPVRLLKKLESQIEQHTNALTEATAELDGAKHDLGNVPETMPRLDPETIHRVEEKLKYKRDIDADIRRINAELEQLPNPDSSFEDPEQLRTARSELLRWLLAPARPRRDKRWEWGVGVALLSAVAGIVVAVVQHPAFIGLFVLLSVGVWQARPKTDSHGDERRTAERRFRESGIQAPERWEQAAVQERLQALDRELLDTERAQAAHERAVTLKRQRDARKKDRHTADDALAKIAKEVGFDPGKLDAALDRWLYLLSKYDRAYSAAELARQHLKHAEEEANVRREQVIVFLRTHDAAPVPDGPDADALDARLDDLSGRIRKRDEARREIESAEQEAQRSKDRIGGLQANIRDLFRQVGIEAADETTLRERIELLDDWRALRQELYDALSVERDRRQAVVRDDLIELVEADDKLTLQQRQETLERQATKYQSINDEISQIEADIKLAQRERALESARAQEQQAYDQLVDRIDEALFATAGSLLLEQVSSEHQRTSQPESLRRAKAWFQRFTHHQFELDFDTDDCNRFAALETNSGERRTLSELSSGTRMQLLLAVRIAFALEAEKGREPLPLILDEVLTTADPERFHAAAESLHVLAQEDNRQIFYLTAQPADLAYWQEFDKDVHWIDLAQVRGAGQSITDPNQIKMPERQDIPAPDGQTPEDYAVALGVPALDPWNALGAVHLFYLLRDQLDLLYRLIQARIEHIGELQSVLDSKTANLLLSDTEKKLLRCRIAGADAWLEAWRLGRGQPLDHAALEEAPAISEKYFNRVSELADEVNRDANRLLDELDNKAVSGFGPQKVERLRGWLADQGYLDYRDPLSKAEMEHEVLSVIATYLDNTDSSLKEARVLNDSLISGIRKPI